MKLNFKNFVVMAAMSAIVLSGCGGGGSVNGGLTNEEQINTRYYNYWVNAGKGNVDGAMQYVSMDYLDGTLTYDWIAAWVKVARFTVTNYDTSAYAFTSDYQWSTITTSLRCNYTDGTYRDISGYEYFHKVNGQWMICGHDGRATTANANPNLVKQAIDAYTEHLAATKK